MTSLMSLLITILSPAVAAPGSPSALAQAHLSSLTDAPFETATTTLHWVGGDRVRLAPRVGGLPVFGATVVVALPPSSAPILHGPLPSWSQPGPPRFNIDAAAAARAAAALAGDAPAAWSPRAEAGWRVEGDTLAESWIVSIARMAPFMEWRVLVDGRTGEVLAAAPASRSVEGPVADIYPTNPLVSEVTRVTLAETDGDALSGRYADIWSCHGQGPGGLLDPGSCDGVTRYALPDGAGDYLFEPAPAEIEDPFAEVQLYHHLDFMARWLEGRWGLVWPWAIRGFVNFEMTNAFYGDFDGDGQPDVSFGQSPDGIDFGYDADVIYHELGHGVVDAVSSVGFVSADAYGMDWAPGSLNEGTADVFAMILTGDPQMAEYAGSFDGRTEPIRDLEAARTCPESLWGEVHADGELWGSLLWGIQTWLGPDMTAELLWGALTSWTAPPTWPQAGQSLRDSAKGLYSVGYLDEAERDRVYDAIDEAGLLTCTERVIPLSEGAPVQQLAVNLGLTGDFGEVPLGSQFSLIVPDRGEAVRFRVLGFESEAPGMAWTVFARRGEPVEHEVLSYASLGLAFAVPDRYDLSEEGAGEGELVITDVEPGETWYFSLASRNAGGLEPLAFTTALVTVDGAIDRAVTVRAEPSCSCTAAPEPSGLGWLLGLVGLVGLRRYSSAKAQHSGSSIAGTGSSL